MARKCADNGACSRDGSPRPSDRFLTGLEPFRCVTFVSHVHPDPDSLAAMMGLAHLVEVRLKKPTRLTRDGLISRAENRAMVELLDIELYPIDKLDWAESEAVVMVDSQPNTGRHNLDDDCPLYAVLDHHDTPGDLEGVPFTDIRHDLGATCTLVTQYLREQQVEIPPRLATGLLYAIETEVSGYPREAGPQDEDALLHLYPLANKEIISRIRNARLPQSHFMGMLRALQSSFIYDRLIISWVSELPQPELAAEVVDFLVRFEEVDYAVCAGVFEDKLVLSARAAVEGAKIGDVLRQVVGKLGRAGGHDRRAGGTIPLASTSARAVEEIQGELRRRLLRVLHIDECRGQRLMPRREMLQNLQA
jgi:nanoRNase/pAp phosphatase (c-di-AMP/oligoRNAs hydrolase)